MPGDHAGPTSLISSAQDLTTSWVDLGVEIETAYFNSIALWLNIDINNSANVRVRLLAKHTKDGDDEYTLPIRTVGATDIKLDAEYQEFNTDADQKMVPAWDVDNAIPFVQFQVQVSATGATAAQIDSAYVTMGY